MQKNIKLFPIYKLFSYDVLFYYAISILFLTITKGFSLSQVALLSSIYATSAIICQIPASIIADKIGYKNSMIIGNLLCMSWALLYILVPTFNILMFAEFLCALGFALKGVAESPFIYAVMKKEGQLSSYSKVEGRGSSYYFVAEAIASVAAGYLFYINAYLPMIFGALCFLIATVMSFYMKPIKTPQKEILTPKEHFAEMFSGFKFIFKSKRLHALLIFAAVFNGVVALSSLYIKSFLTGINVSSTLFGYIFALASVASAIGAAIQERIEKKYKNKTLSAVSIIFITSFVVIGIFSLIVESYMPLLIIGTIVFLVQTFIKGAYRIIIKEYVNRYTTSSIRSKLMSIYYLVESFGSAVLTFIASKTIDLVPIGISYCVFGFGLFIVLILILNYMSSRVGLDPNKYTKSDRMDLQ